MTVSMQPYSMTGFIKMLEDNDNDRVSSQANTKPVMHAVFASVNVHVKCQYSDVQ